MSLLRSLFACGTTLVCVAALAAPVNERLMLNAAQNRADWGRKRRRLVVDGTMARADQGMVGFASVLTPADAEAVRAWLVHTALTVEEAR